MSNRLFLLWTTILAACGFTTPAYAQARFAGWHTDWKTAQAQAAKSGKPLFVVFRCVR